MILKRFYGIGFILSLVCCHAFGQIIQLNDHASPTKISSKILFAAPSKDLTFDEMLQMATFKPADNSLAKLGIQRHSVWVKFSVKNTSLDSDFILNTNNENLESASLYTYQDSVGKFSVVTRGNKFPFNQREIKSPSLMFPLSVPPGATRTYYLKLKSRLPIQLPLTIGRANAQITQANLQQIFNGIYAGIILVMALYNLFIAFYTKSKSYWYYVLYVLFIGLTQLTLDGFTYRFLWPKIPYLALHAMAWFACCGGVFALLFIMHFLKVKRYAQWSVIPFKLSIALFILTIPLLFLRNPKIGFYLMQLNTGIISIFGMIVAISVMKVYRPARYIVVGWAVLVFASIVFILKDYGLMPHNGWTENSVRLGSIIEIILISLGLADRINRLRDERDASQHKALEMSLENERIVSKQNEILAQKVAERTAALEETNKALNLSMTHLKQAQSQLVATEKMSSLGQLTAGIAHEINNPINFVSANVKPLKRDIQQLYDALAEIENLSFQDKPIDQKKSELAAYKKDTELDYVKSEIKQLLDGIHEGAGRTATIVKGLRTFSRTDDDTLKKTNINEGLASTLSVVANKMKGIHIEVNYGEIPAIYCYPGRLNQVFLNILVNAAYAIHKKHGDNVGGNLTVTTYIEGDDVCVSIKDDGIGMDETTKAKIFEPFFTTKEVGEGTGLGMSIAFSILEKHQAVVIVNSQPGEGSEFLIKLPNKPF